MATVAPASAVAASTQKKRAAETSADPSMNKTSAKKALSALKAPPKCKAATQSQYVRFKSLLQKDAKARGDKDTTDNITKIAKEAWKRVQHLTPPLAMEDGANTNDVASSSASNLGEDVQRYLRIKGTMLKEEKEMQAKFDTEVNAYCAAFVTAAYSYLKWCLIEATEDNQQTLLEACELVKKKRVLSHFFTCGVDNSSVTQLLGEADDQLVQFKTLKDERALVAKLQNASEEELKQHAKEHIRLLAQDAQFVQLQRKKAIDDERQRQIEERELEKADGIEDEVCRALKKQMKYGNLSSKHSSSRNSYVKGGVSEKVFAKAFNVKVGTKQATFEGHKVGYTFLRYGASLQCNEVKVKLVGDELVATTSFYMDK